MNRQTITLKMLPSANFATFGVSVMAYVKKVDRDDGSPAYAIYAADGTRLGIETSERTAMLAIQQQNLFPVMVQ